MSFKYNQLKHASDEREYKFELILKIQMNYNWKEIFIGIKIKVDIFRGEKHS